MMLFLLLVFSLFAQDRDPYFPYLSGDAFRAVSDFVFDRDASSFNVRHVAPNSTIFVETNFIALFFKKVHPKLQVPYILITHNSDLSAPGDYRKFLKSEKILAWYGQNVDYSHPKMHPIPIGIANRKWRHGNGDLLKQVAEKKREKKHFLYLNITVATYPSERQEVVSLLSQLPGVHTGENLEFEAYLEALASSVFVASPRGNGLDTHRLWEALYLGSYPIVKSSLLDPLYENLPVVIVSDWKEVTVEFLLEKEKEFSKREFNFETLYIDYWKKKFASHVGVTCDK